ncbi:60s acidic ribosomal protein [Ditylenchus destructor]|nr:60s acidic ribosomal protein [Ditylenchus destructor]
MKYVAAYLLANLGGNASPTAKDIEKILGAASLDVDMENANAVVNALKGKEVGDVIAAGQKKLASLQRKKKRRKNRRMRTWASDCSTEEIRIIQLILNGECFKGKDIRNLDSKDSLSIYGFLCSLLAYALKEFSIVNNSCSSNTLPSRASRNAETNKGLPSANITVLICSPAKIVKPKVLRIILRACQSALAYKIKQCIVLERDVGSFHLGQQKILGLDILMDCYDFKTVLCSRSKLWKHGVNHGDYILNEQDKSSEICRSKKDSSWDDITNGFLEFTSQNPSYFGTAQFGSVDSRKDKGCSRIDTNVANLGRLLRKDHSIAIELLGRDSDTIRKSSIISSMDSVYSQLKEPNIVPDTPQKCAPLFKNSQLNPSGATIPIENNLKSNEKAKWHTTVSKDVKSMEEVIQWVRNIAESKLSQLDVQWAYDTDKQNGKSSSTIQLTPQMVEEEHKRLSAETEKMMDKSSELAELVETLQRQMKNNDDLIHDSELGIVVDLAEKMTSLVHGFRVRLNRQQLKMVNWHRFQEAIMEFHSDSDSLIMWLCSERSWRNCWEAQNNDLTDYASKMTRIKEAIQNAIALLKGKLNSVEERIETVLETGTALCTLLRLYHEEDDDNNVNPSETSDFFTAEQEKRQHQITCIMDDLSSVTERRKRCCELVELRTEKLNQMLEIIKCEQYTMQIYQKISDSAKCLKDGKKPMGRLLNNGNTEKRLFNFARQLIDVGITLRKIHQLDPVEGILMKGKLEKTWKEFTGHSHTITRYS